MPSNGASVRHFFDISCTAICSFNGSGFLKRKKNVINSITGTDIMTSSVC